MSNRRYIEFRCSSEPSAELEIVTFEGREHLVVPVIALIGDTVIQASNAPTPEYIPSSVISSSVLSWNGRPVVPGHPKSNGKAISANSPKVFDSSRMGFIFETKFEDNKLKMRPYLDIERCNEIGGDAKLTIEKLQDGKSIDVSVGAIVDTEEVKGMTLAGKEYGAIWVELSGDHLASLPSGVGACSQSMGCGAPRIAEGVEETNRSESDKENDMPDDANAPVAIDRAAERQPKRDFFSRLLAKFRPSVIFDDGNSDDELRMSLAAAIREVEHSFDCICSTYPDSGVVIYMTYEGYGTYSGTYQYWRRTFSVDTSGKKITLNDDAIEVQPKRVWETVDEEVETMSGKDELENENNNNSNKQLRAAECACKKGEETMANAEARKESRKEAINEFIKSGRFAEEDRKVLESVSELMSENGWKALAGNGRVMFEKEETKAAEEKPAEKVVAAENKSEPTSPPPLTEAAVLAAFPDLNRIVTGYRAAESKRRCQLVTQLSAAQTVYNEDALKAKSLDNLEEIAKLVGLEASPVDFSLRGMPVIESETRAAAAAPDGWATALKGKAN